MTSPAEPPNAIVRSLDLEIGRLRELKHLRARLRFRADALAWCAGLLPLPGALGTWISTPETASAFTFFALGKVLTVVAVFVGNAGDRDARFLDFAPYTLLVLAPFFWVARFQPAFTIPAGAALWLLQLLALRHLTLRQLAAIPEAS